MGRPKHAEPDLRIECRDAVREFLSQRPGLAFDLTAINRRLPFENGEIAAQLSSLMNLKQVQTIASRGVIYFKATDRGIEEYEKGAYR